MDTSIRAGHRNSFGSLYYLAPWHTNFARIRDSEENFFEQLFTDEHRETEAVGGESQNASLLKFIGMHIVHIFTGILRPDAQYIAAAFLVAEGLYWFVGRSVKM